MAAWSVASVGKGDFITIVTGFRRRGSVSYRTGCAFNSQTSLSSDCNLWPAHKNFFARREPAPSDIVFNVRFESKGSMMETNHLHTLLLGSPESWVSTEPSQTLFLLLMELINTLLRYL